MLSDHKWLFPAKNNGSGRIVIDDELLLGNVFVFKYASELRSTVAMAARVEQ